MEKGEPTLVPQWLRSGSVSVGGNATHPIASSSNSDAPSSTYPSRNKSFKSIIDLDRPILERSASSDSRRSISSNGFSKHPYSSFGRSNRDKERERDKERTTSGDHRDFDLLGTMPTGRILKDTLLHSRSMGSRNGHKNGNGVHSGKTIGSSIKKVVFEKDFPSLGSDERHDIRRAPSPSLTSAIQSLPIGNSAMMGAEGWSALAEVPSMAPQLAHQSAPVPASCAPGTIPGLNMAEALSQVPSRSQNAPQVSAETQRLEELAIRKSRQLVPMTPSMPKALMSSSSDKLKPKTSVRSGEIIATPKAGLQSASQTLRGGQVKSEAPKTSQAGKFHVLKPVRDNNGVSHAAKDVASPTNNLSSPPAVPLLPNNPKHPTLERKTAPLPLHLVPASEKKPISQAQSRSDFFNLIRKKTSMNSSTVEKASSDEVIKEVIGDSGNPHVKSSAVASNGDSSEEAKKFSDEEEIAFLRSLGWDENGGEDEGLTEEEINAFYQECLKLKPSLKMCQGMQPKLSIISESHATNLGGADVCSSSCDSEA